MSLYKDVRRATHACTWGHHLMHGFDGSRVHSAHVHTWVVREIRTNRDASITRAYDTSRGQRMACRRDASYADSVHDFDDDAKVSVTCVRYRPALGIIYPLPLLIEATSFLPPEALPLSQPPPPIRFHHCN
ncbi:hypothetical protein MUK42_36469 [Musa troglodytarum]|uniref:Uncharacterized protein n=1 Tax=Musa troglodytarum TaxID=320322 RepID=A0A9E7FJC8_9LILI|nr:hypothetical protein MUK42_36469 [Musa troglodytarum]